MRTFNIGDQVTLSKKGLQTLESEYLSIGERIHLTRLCKQGGQVTGIYPQHIAVAVDYSGRMDQRVLPLHILIPK